MLDISENVWKRIIIYFKKSNGTSGIVIEYTQMNDFEGRMKDA